MRKFVAVAILVPLAIVIVMFAVANREIITVSFDPFDSAHPAFALKMPLFMLIFVLVGARRRWSAASRPGCSSTNGGRGRGAPRPRRAICAPGSTPSAPRRNVPAALDAPPPFVVPPAA